MEKMELNLVSSYVDDRISISKLTNTTFIGVDNMLPNYGGISESKYLPTSGSATHFKPGDILIGNIRPYFKKIWYATFEGGCSNDVLVIRSNDRVSSKYLYACLATQHFFDYDLSGAKGSKMPRGDKAHIMRYVIYRHDNLDCIGDLVLSINKKIYNNNKIIIEFDKLIRELFSYYFLQFDFPNENGNPYKSSGNKLVYNEDLKMEIPEGWEVKTVGDIIIEKPKSKIQINHVGSNNGKIPFFTSGEDILKVDKSLVFGKHLFLSTGGNSHISFYDGEAAYSTDTWCLSAKDNLEVYLYQWIKFIGKYMDTKFFAGTGLKHLQKDLFKKEFILIPARRVLEEFNKYAYVAYKYISSLYLENEELKSLRDFLLPLLMNGQAIIRD